MSVNPDYKDLFKIFNEEKVDYLVVGAHAVIFYTEPRYTKDLDVLVRISNENKARVYKALKKFGAPLKGIKEKAFSDPEMIYQIGIAPNRIDIIMSIAGVDFEDAWKRKEKSAYGGIPINIICRKDLVRAKRASNRPQDQLDVKKLLIVKPKICIGREFRS